MMDVNDQADGFIRPPDPGTSLDVTGIGAARPRAPFGALPLPVRMAGYAMVVVGYFGTVCKPTTLINLRPDWVQKMNAKAAGAVTSEERIGLIVQVAVGVPISLMALVGGVAMLWMKPWSRKLILLYCVSAVIATIAFAAVDAMRLNRAVDSYVAASTQPVDREQLIWAQGGYLGMSALGKLVLPLGVFAVMNSSNAKRYLS
jgi:hypothetical protein